MKPHAQPSGKLQPRQNHHFSIEESSFLIEESLKNLHFLLKNLDFYVKNLHGATQGVAWRQQLVASIKMHRVQYKSIMFGVKSIMC